MDALAGVRASRAPTGAGNQHTSSVIFQGSRATGAFDLFGYRANSRITSGPGSVLRSGSSVTWPTIRTLATLAHE